MKDTIKDTDEQPESKQFLHCLKNLCAYELSLLSQPNNNQISIDYILYNLEEETEVEPALSKLQ